MVLDSIRGSETDTHNLEGVFGAEPQDQEQFQLKKCYFKIMVVMKK